MSQKMSGLEVLQHRRHRHLL